MALKPIKERRKVFKAHSTLPRSRDMIPKSKECEDSEQTRSPTYRLAFDDLDFILKDEQRSVRLMLEWQKPDQILNDAQITATWPIFGSARLRSACDLSKQIGLLEQQLDSSPADNKLLQKRATTQSLLDKAHYYDECQKLAALLSEPSNTGIEATVITGGGPGIMEAANKGAAQAGKPSIGLNIVLPTEQEPNHYITPEYCFQFHYFAIRKMHFLVRAKALFAFPGGFGTLDEVMETLTLIQTGRIQAMPVFLFGKNYWQSIINFEALVAEGVISPDDLSLFHYIETADEAINGVREFYANA
ncbi:MAG: TIGR00730 family Rossman fold protein [Gammaproteobacteria bacterium]|nr:TIGR00730 family Rossman fold protein [Gammaproteobacteria bacterium]